MRKRTKITVLKAAVNICRVLLGGTFIFSGFVKANDPMGTVYKLHDYLASFSLDILPDTFLLGCSVMLSVFEFMLGIDMLFAMNKKRTALLTTFFMGIMTLLTIYIVIANPVSDCGCFGDAIILSNEATLGKNIVLMAAALIVLQYKKLLIDKVKSSLKGFISLISFCSIVAYIVYCIVCLPHIDFRPYKVGTDLRTELEKVNSQSSFDVKIIYEKDGQTLELSTDDDDPDSTWTYIETKRTPTEGTKLELSNFYIYNADDEEITDDIVYADGYTLLLIIPNLLNADEGCVDKVNELYDEAIDQQISFYCLTASSDDKSQNYWRDHTGAEYEYSIADDRLLKTIVRGNPGLVLMKDGVIVNKWSNYNLPSSLADSYCK